jgi:hypothetical protein
MPLNDHQRRGIAAFRTGLEAHIEAISLFSAPAARSDREDEATLTTRWQGAERVWYEVTVRPFLPQVRAGVLTDDRWQSEAFEQMIEDSGDTMQEFLELGFETAGLEWAGPPVEHYREQGRYFYFATPIDLCDLAELADDSLRRKVQLMIEGYLLAFGGKSRQVDRS